MNKTFLVALILFSLSFTAKAQDASVEKSIFGIQLGAIGLWAHNEAKLSQSIALRTEVGAELGFYSSSFINDSGVYVVPSITLEPRWYYNLNKRVSKSRRIDGNSGNFVSLKVNYHPDLLLTSLKENYNFISDLTIIPTWGIRRNIGKHFNYETAIGVGYIKYFEEANTFFEQADIGVNIHLRIGYKF
ncbi:hypothetical protein [Lacinutrix venerupis]|uniref:Outer membrane protein with beta-barrel domain n=1 Tax=Lacinutrix venerupis TaxID=1486034 RepID=A0AAC9LLD7_9FLAO|nr:hypothetical protein [Lacinutrix venerupis]APX99702.1 hypothetical protein BWR22_05040 [Lacinutrix venerupis]